MNPSLKKFLFGAGGYLAAGVLTAGYSAYLYGQAKPRFEGLGGSGSGAALLETVLLWPYAMYVNFTGTGGTAA